MGRHLVETPIGAAVLVVTVGFISDAQNRSNVATVASEGLLGGKFMYGSGGGKAA